MKPRSLGLATVLGLLITAIGIVVPIVWDRYKSRTALELRLLSNSVVVGRSQEIDKLQFVYAGNTVPSLSRIELELTNTGRTPIRQADVVTPVTIRLHNARILDARISKVSPANLELSHEQSPAQDAITIRFPLFNPGDAAYLTLFAATDRAELSGSARIAGLDNLAFIASPTNVSPVRQERGWTFYVVAVMSGLAILIFLATLYTSGVETAIARLSQRDAIIVPSHAALAFTSWRKEVFGDFKAPAFKTVDQWLATLPQSEELTTEQRQELHDRVRKALTDMSAMQNVTVLFGILALIGSTYILYRIW